MNIKEQILVVEGKNVESLWINDKSLQFSSKVVDSVEEFKESWSKKISLSNKVDIKIDSLKSIEKEANEDEIKIKYKGLLNLTSDFEFNFKDKEDCVSFFNHLENDLNFTKNEVKLSPLKAITTQLIFLALTFGGTYLGYLQAIAMENGTLEESHGRKTRIFNKAVEVLGLNGVLAVGAIISAILIYQIYKRFINPPVQIKFLPKN